MTNHHKALWSLPILVILSFLWYKRKRSGTSSDPGGTGERTTRRRGESSSDGEGPEEVLRKVLKSGGDSLQTVPVPQEEVESVPCTVKVVSLEEKVETPELPTEQPQSEAVADILECPEIGLQKQDPEEIYESDVQIVDQEVVQECVPKNGSSDITTAYEGSGEAYQGLIDILIDQYNQSDLAIQSYEQELCAVKELLTAINNSNVEDAEVPVATVEEEVVEEEVVHKVEIISTESSRSPVKQDSRTEVGVVTEDDGVECNLEISDVKSEEEKSPLLEEVDKAAEQELLLVGAMARDEDVRTDEKPTRDSANHSPAEVMLGSPSASSFSDEGSSDSGKGCSDVATPPSRTPVGSGSVSGDVPGPSVYEFVLPQSLVGKLIGRHGAFVQQIKAKTNASVLIKRHPDTGKLKICAVEGSQMDIENALEMIRKKFPLKVFPSMTLEQVYFVPPVPTVPLLPDCLQLSLVEGVNNDVILSSLVSPSHFFLQQPTHPTFPSLNRLNTYMNVCYSEPSAPLLPTPVDVGIICVAPTMGGWFRAQVVSAEPNNEVYEVKFVDYGGYLSLEHSALRQIRTDFMTLPFQASECYLANVMPVGGEDALWSPEAMTAVEELTQGQVLQAQVLDYAQDGVPIVMLCAIHNGEVVMVNQELVNRGVAEWCTPVSEEEA